MDVIARCAFGMTINNLGEKGDPFMSNAKAIFNPDANKTPLILLPCKCSIKYCFNIDNLILKTVDNSD